MNSEIITILYFLMWYFLIGLACLYLILGLDELFFDAYYWCSYLGSFWKNRKKKKLIYEKLFSVKEQSIAVMIPCWQEAGVIGKMLTYNRQAIDYEKYYFFVGVYPNDKETMNEVMAVSQKFGNIHCVINDQKGPTNKASNLNAIYQHIKVFEMALNKPFDVFVLHDSEDLIHPLSFKLYNYLIPDKDMIQIPVFPLSVGLWRFTHWLYAEEFAEAHTKTIIVRQSISGHVPSAGVGTAFSKKALKEIENPVTQAPFCTDSLTEDYRVSLAMHVKKFKQAFITQSLIRMQWKRKSFWRSGYQLKPMKERIATHAYFPMDYKSSVRQKARWIIGIVFQEWHTIKWPKGWRLRYVLARDRKSGFSHILTGIGYFVFLFWVGYSLTITTHPAYPTFSELLHFHTFCKWLLFANLFIMAERMLQRMIATFRIYGIVPAFISIPRALYGNVLNLHALIRAYKVYYKSLISVKAAKKRSIQWDKTRHAFPLQSEYAQGPKLGNLLVEKGLINKEQLYSALAIQEKTQERLGAVLCRLGHINQRDLAQLLASQYHMALLPHSVKTDIGQDLFSNRLLRWLKRNDIVPVALNENTKTIQLAVPDPTNALLLKKIENRMLPLNVEFVLLEPADSYEPA